MGFDCGWGSWDLVVDMSGAGWLFWKMISDGIMLDGMDVAVWDDDFRWMAREIVRHVVMMGGVVIYGSIADCPPIQVLPIHSGYSPIPHAKERPT
jgi:hypothetical protein